MTTIAEEEDEDGIVLRNGKHAIADMIDPNLHTCGQIKVDILVEKFKSAIKEKMSKAIKVNYHLSLSLSHIHTYT